MKKFLVFVLLLAIGSAVWWFFFRGPEDNAIKVLDTDVVKRGAVSEVLQATGIVKTQVGAEVKIGAQATGRIEQMLVRVGDIVEAGQLVAVIDDRELQTRKREAEATLARTRAELRRVQRVYPLQIREAEANVISARARADLAMTTLARRQSLFTAGSVAEGDLDEAKENARVTANELAAREATLERLQAEYSEELNKAEKTVDEAEAGLDAVDVRISYTRIFSPMTGKVSQVTGQEGETVVAGLQVANLVTVMDSSRLEMWIYVDETDVGRVQAGLPVEFIVDAFPDRVYETAISQIYPKPEIRDNIVYYQALCPVTQEQAETLRPEMTTQCSIVVQQQEDALIIPNTALKWVGDSQYVFVQEPDGSVRRVSPELGLAGVATSEVLSGLEEGDIVATQLVLPASVSSASNRGGGR